MTPQELKNSILQLAIQGKLVPQRPGEGTGEELFQKIQAEKRKLVKAGKIKKEKPLPEIGEDEVPFEIPEGWRWVRLNSVVSLQSGADLLPERYNSNGKGIPYITGASNIDGESIVINRWTEYPNNVANRGDLLLTCKGTVGKTHILTEKIAHIARQIMAITPIGTDVRYIQFFIQSQVEYLKSKAKSMIPGIERDNVLNLSFPLPPLAEQKRIVAKIEDLLPLIDRYAAAWGRLEEFNQRFPTDLRKSVLQLAIQGKLVPQRPEEGTGEELYQQIQAEKRKLVKAGKIKKEKPLPEIGEDEVPFEIPEGWRWVRLGQICDILDSMRRPITKSDRKAGPYPYYGASCVQDHVADYIFDEPLVLLGEDGAKWGKGSSSAYSICGKSWVNNHAHVLRPLGNIVHDYLVHALCISDLTPFVTGTTVPKLNQERMCKIPLPLPPLAEQKRIVAKLEEILPLCERLR